MMLYGDVLQHIELEISFQLQRVDSTVGFGSQSCMLQTSATVPSVFLSHLTRHVSFGTLAHITLFPTWSQSDTAKDEAQYIRRCNVLDAQKGR